MAKSRIEYRQEIELLQRKCEAVTADLQGLRKLFNETHKELIERRNEVVVLLNIIRKGY